MIYQIGLILILFKDCFSRTATFNWFVIIIMGFIVRLDHHGITSIIRWLGLDSSLYTALLSFFRASSWQLPDIQQRWQHIVVSRCPPITVAGRYLIAGDGIKISKEAQKMPGVKKLHQESDNSGKAPYIYGHHFGVLGILCGSVKKRSFPFPCAPRFMKVSSIFEHCRASEPLLSMRKRKSALPP